MQLAAATRVLAELTATRRYRAIKPHLGKAAQNRQSQQRIAGLALN
jgi:hypothetical protein